MSGSSVAAARPIPGSRAPSRAALERPVRDLAQALDGYGDRSWDRMLLLG